MSKLNDFLLQFGSDKFMHFVVGGLVMGITSSWIVVGVVGIGKELYDYNSYGNFSKADAIVTIGGGIFAYVAKLIWDLIPFTIF
tara:strand:+ start:298 stop:549 length:252 start_codon:yes stop_codon:yes gene_type:complete